MSTVDWLLVGIVAVGVVLVGVVAASNRADRRDASDRRLYPDRSVHTTRRRRSRR